MFFSLYCLMQLSFFLKVVKLSSPENVSPSRKRRMQLELATNLPGNSSKCSLDEGRSALLIQRHGILSTS